jgi:hypothetical protein
MSWAVVPEIFFDLLARVVPGSAILLAALVVILGPEEGVEALVEHAAGASLGSISAFVLAAYLTAVVLKQVWELFESRFGRRAEGSNRDKIYEIYCGVRGKDQLARADYLPDDRIILSCIRRSLPDDGLRLLKIQAEKNLCETLLPGLASLLLLDLWFLFFSGASFGRAWLLLLIAVSWLSFFRWRESLEILFRHDLCALWRLLEVAGRDFVLAAEKER